MTEPTYKTIDKFDRMMGALHDLPDVTRTKPTTIVANTPIIGATQTFIIQTLRQREVGDTIFLQYVDDNGSQRIAIPPAAADAIARQRDSLTTKVRKRVSKDAARARKAAGFVPFKKKPEGEKRAKAKGPSPTENKELVMTLREIANQACEWTSQMYEQPSMGYEPKYDWMQRQLDDRIAKLAWTHGFSFEQVQKEIQEICYEDNMQFQADEGPYGRNI